MPAPLHHGAEGGVQNGSQDISPTQSDEWLLAASDVSVTKAGRDILQHVSLEVNAGEIVTLIGPNGAGKTTLVRVLLGITLATRGRVDRRPGLLIGYAPQLFTIDPAVPLTVKRFLQLGGAATESAVASVLAEVGARRLIDRQIARLSGGEFQRVLLARALLRQPHLLVLDEPVRGVDYLGEAELYALIGDIRRQRNCGVLLVSHDLHVVMSASDRVICLNRHICCQGVPETVAMDPEYRRLFGSEAARSFGLYRHAHDHSHDLGGGISNTGAKAIDDHDSKDRPLRDHCGQEPQGHPDHKDHKDHKDH